MRAELISISDKAASTLDHWQKAYAGILNIGISRDSANARTPGLTVGDVAARVSAGLAVMAGFRGAESEPPAVLSNRLPALMESIDVIDQRSTQLLEHLRSWEGATHVDQNKYLDLNITHPKKGLEAYDLGSAFAEISKRATTLLDALPYVALAASDKGISVYAGPARAATKHLAHVKLAACQTMREPGVGRVEALELKKLLGSASTLLKEVEALKASMLVIKCIVDAQATKVTQKHVRMTETSNSTSTLRQKIIKYQPQSDPFREQMDALLEHLRQLGVYSKETERDNKNGKEEIDEPMDKTDTMIRSATTVNLSIGLEDGKSGHDKRLARARMYVVLSAVVLLVSALPIVVQLISNPWQPDFATALQGVGALSFVLLPAAWACSFFSKDYAELARLSKKYAHKDSRILTETP